MIDPIIVQCNDIAKTAREVDCVVNASNPELANGGGVAGGIHKAFGEALGEDAEDIEAVSAGSCIMMGQYPLPANDEADAELKADVGDIDDSLWKWTSVIHTVAPRDGNPDWRFILERCYTGCLDLVKDHNRKQFCVNEDHSPIKSIAFPMLGTGAYCLPHEDADAICFNTVADWLDVNTPDGGLEVRLIVGPYAQSSGDRAIAMAARVTRWLHNKKISAGIS